MFTRCAWIDVQLKFSHREGVLPLLQVTQFRLLAKASWTRLQRPLGVNRRDLVPLGSVNDAGMNAAAERPTVDSLQ